LITTNLQPVFSVIPAQAGIQRDGQLFLDSGLRRNDFNARADRDKASIINSMTAK